MTTLIPTDVYDKNGNMLRIEYYDMTGSHVLDVVWDENDPQDSEHREYLRKWGAKMLKQKGYEVHE